MAEIEGLVNRLIDARNADDVEATVSVFSPNAVRMIGASRTEGRDALRTFYTRTGQGLTDRSMRLRRLTVCGSRAVLEYFETARHTGPVQTSFGTIQPTGESLEIFGCNVMDFDETGIVEAHVYSDTLFKLLALSKQLETR